MKAFGLALIVCAADTDRFDLAPQAAGSWTVGYL